MENINALRKGDFSFTDAKAFVHNWFANIDAGNADELMNLTSNEPLNINILGNKVTDKAAFKGFLVAQQASQNYSAHTPAHIQVQQNEKAF